MADVNEDTGYIDIDIDNLVNPNDPPKEGEARLLIEKAELTTSKGNERMIKLQCKVVNHDDPDSIGKFIFENYMLEGKGEKMGKWAWGQLNKTLGLDGRAVGAVQGLEADAYVIQVPPKDGYGASARVREWLSA